MDDDLRCMVKAFNRLHPANRQHMAWRISEERLRRLAKRMGMPIPDDAPPPTDGRLLDIPIEIVECEEIELVMKVTGK